MRYQVKIKRKILRNVEKMPKSEQIKLALLIDDLANIGTITLAEFQQTLRHRIPLPFEPEMGCLLAA
jgi:hypothetical protein